MDVYMRFHVQSPGQAPSSKKYSWVNPRHSPPKEPSLMLLFLDLKEKMHNFSLMHNFPLAATVLICIYCFLCFVLSAKPTETNRSQTPHPTRGASQDSSWAVSSPAPESEEIGLSCMLFPWVEQKAL